MVEGRWTPLVNYCNHEMRMDCPSRDRQGRSDTPMEVADTSSSVPPLISFGKLGKSFDMLRIWVFDELKGRRLGSVQTDVAWICCSLDFHRL